GTFKYFSLLASNFEKIRLYHDAAQNWHRAALVAKKYDNRQWAIRRKDFCLMRLKFNMINNHN
ncbi:ANR family transcriptional regulator, partial [Escherichia coli]|nr:ANR family transcriptional regulator [Escherichia coli]